MCHEGGNMEKFIYLMKMTFMTKLAYVKAFWINIAGTFASIVIYYFLWQFVFRQQDSLAGYTAAEMTAYGSTRLHGSMRSIA